MLEKLTTSTFELMATHYDKVVEELTDPGVIMDRKLMFMTTTEARAEHAADQFLQFAKTNRVLKDVVLETERTHGAISVKTPTGINFVFAWMPWHD